MDEIIDVEDIENNHMLKQVGNLFLTGYQIDLLNRYSIKPETYNNLEELMVAIDAILPALDDEEYDELDNIYQVIAERNYYENTNK